MKKKSETSKTPERKRIRRRKKRSYKLFVDVCFRAVFGAEDSKEQLLGLLDAILGALGIAPIEDVVIRNPIQLRTFRDDKSNQWIAVHKFRDAADPSWELPETTLIFPRAPTAKKKSKESTTNCLNVGSN